MRVNMNIPEELLHRLDDYAKDNYQSRSSVMCQACDQFLSAKEMQKMFGELNKLLCVMSDRIKDEGEVDEETFKKMDELLSLTRMISGHSLNAAELDPQSP